MNRAVGTPTWIEFRSTDMASSRSFYEQLFGWEITDSGPEMGHYLMARKDGGWVCGGMDVTGMTCPQGKPLPATWMVYLAVDDVDARTRKAVEHGATVVVEPGDAGGAGRFSIVLGPDQAAVGLWQAGDMAGYDFTGKPGTPVWFELMTKDFAKAVEFYREVFDFDITPMTGQEYDGMTYATNGPADKASSGICDASSFPVEVGDSAWRIYFQAESCDPALEQVRALGGKVLDGPYDTPFGRLATVADPCGATFQLGATSEANTSEYGKAEA